MDNKTIVTTTAGECWTKQDSADLPTLPVSVDALGLVVESEVIPMRSEYPPECPVFKIIGQERPVELWPGMSVDINYNLCVNGYLMEYLPDGDSLMYEPANVEYPLTPAAFDVFRVTVGVLSDQNMA